MRLDHVRVINSVSILPEMVAQWQWGVMASLLGSFFGTLGGQLRICSLAYTGRVALLLQGTGWILWLSGQGLGQVAILLAPATVAACVIFSSSLLWNALLAPLVLHEHLSRMHGIGIMLLSVGGSAVTWASCHSDPLYTWPELEQLLHRPPTIIVGASAYGVAIVLLVRFAKARILDLYSFAYMFALIGATDLCVTKFTLQLIRLQVEQVDEGSRPSATVTTLFTLLMCGLHVGVFGFQVLSAYYRKALQSVPLFLGSGAIMQISLCGEFFKEFNFTSLQLGVFLVGVSLVLTGLVVTSLAASSCGELEEEEEEAAQVKQDSGQQSSLPVVSSGLLARSDSSFSSADYVFISEIQRSNMCFGGKHRQDCIMPLSRKFESMPDISDPLLRSVSLPGRSATVVLPVNHRGFSLDSAPVLFQAPSSCQTVAEPCMQPPLPQRPA